MSARLLAADVLTALRLALAVAVSVVLWMGDFTAAAVVVSTGWITDVADGRLARRSGQPGRLGRWDLAADTAVGAGVLVGLAGAGTVPAGYAVVVLLVFGTWFLGAQNFASSMILQLSAYIPLLWILWVEMVEWWWLPFVTVLLIGGLDWRRLIRVNIPRFLHGVNPRNWTRVG